MNARQKKLARQLREHKRAEKLRKCRAEEITRDETRRAFLYRPGGVVICDDIRRANDPVSPEEMEKVKEWYTSGFSSKPKSEFDSGTVTYNLPAFICGTDPGSEDGDWTVLQLPPAEGEFADPRDAPAGGYIDLG